MAYTIQAEIDPASVAGEIYALKADSRRAILIVEGEADYKIFEKFTDEASCTVVIAHGKQNAVGALTVVRRRGLVGIVCIVDQDYDRFLDIEIDDPDIIVTTEHDIEMEMVQSAAFDKVLAEFGSAEKVTILRQSGIEPRILIRDATHSIGLVRLYSLMHEANLTFEEFGCPHVARTLVFDNKELIRRICNHSRAFSWDHDEILRFIAERDTSEHNRWLICCGHDYATVFGIALQSKLGSQLHYNVTCELIEKFLRLAFGMEEFVFTSIYRGLKAWEARNVPFRVLRV